MSELLEMILPQSYKHEEEIRQDSQDEQDF